jgi:pyruvate,orthophosphate dikinase
MVQAMVHGNMNERSGSGVAFSRNPNSGETAGLYGEYLSTSQGDDIKSGGRTPDSLWFGLGENHLAVFDRLVKYVATLEAQFKDLQEIAFVVENDILYILESVPARRTPLAAVNVAVSLVHEGLLTERQALLRLDPAHMDYFLANKVDPRHSDVGNELYAGNDVVGNGRSGCIGAVVGQLVFTGRQAKDCRDQGISCVLVLHHASAADIENVEAANAVVTLHGGVTSDAAVLLRDMGKPAVVGVKNMALNSANDRLVNATNSVHLHRGDVVTVDGFSGEIYKGKLLTSAWGSDRNYKLVMHWADKYRRMSMQANTMGADGLGVVKTESMFFRSDRIDLMRRAILFDTPDQAKYLLQLQEMQQCDIIDLFRVMDGRSVTIRLLDCPLQVFLPPLSSGHVPLGEEDAATTASRLGVTLGEYIDKLATLSQVDPVLGCRGARMSITSPEITLMQIGAIGFALYFTLLITYRCNYRGKTAAYRCVPAHSAADGELRAQGGVSAGVLHRGHRPRMRPARIPREEAALPAGRAAGDAARRAAGRRDRFS